MRGKIENLFPEMLVNNFYPAAIGFGGFVPMYVFYYEIEMFFACNIRDKQ